MAAATRILVVDDDPIVAESLAEFLRRAGHAVATACDGQEALALIDAQAADPTGGALSGSARVGDEPDAKGAKASPSARASQSSQAVGPFGVVITDLNMPRCDGMAFLKALRRKHESIAAIVITGYGKIESAVEAVRLGAVDYLTKPIVDEELKLAVQRAIRQHALVDENRVLKSQLSERFGLANLVGGDYRMQKVYDLVEAVAASRTTVLIEGESGTGKSMVARAIHARSPRHSGPLVTFACGAIPETLLESELFGHVKGAFTGADTDKPGRLLAADGGTLFIDEINSATAALQLKLLRVLQEKRFEPLGSNQTVEVDVRFVLATNQPLRPLVEAGQFREDLFYRINVVNVPLPALRQRLSDIPLLARHFLDKYAAEAGRTITGISDAAMEAMRRYDWPGNVRELENAIERAVVLTRKPVIDVDDLPDTVRGTIGGGASRPTSNAAGGNLYTPALADGWKPTPLADALIEPEKQIILAALAANDWNRQETARQLNINRTTLYKKMRQFSLDQPEGFAA
jgi:DNA-binding NtrC family response regulator